MKKPKSEKARRRRRQRGTGSIFRKPPCKLWVIQYYYKGRRVREATGLDDFDEAKKLLRQRLHEIDRDEYVAQQQKAKALRVEDLYKSLKMHMDTNTKARKRDLPGRWKHLEPVFGKMKASEVTTDDVLRYTSDRLEKDKAKNATVNRELGALKRMFRFAYKSTPPKVKQVPYIPMLREDNARTGFVDDVGFQQLVSQVPAGELWMRTFLELAYGYGWRRSELLELRVEQVDFALGKIRLEPGTTKNRDGREVRITPNMAALLREAVRGKAKADYVLTRDCKTRDGKKKPIKDMRAVWQGMCVRADLGRWICLPCAKNKRDTPLPDGLKKCAACGAKANSSTRAYRGLNPHDFRRSAVRNFANAGVPDLVAMKITGHKTRSVYDRYHIVNEADQGTALETLARWRTEQAARAAAEKPLAPFTAPLASQAAAAAKGAKPN